MVRHCRARPVRTVTVEKREAATAITLTGRVESSDEAALGFRIGGRIIERPVNVGDRVKAGQILARLEPQNEMNALRAAQANLVAAQARLTEARNRFERQQTLLGQGWTTRANFDLAEKASATSQAQVDAADAQLQAAHDLVSFTELKADAPGRRDFDRRRGGRGRASRSDDCPPRPPGRPRCRLRCSCSGAAIRSR